MPSSGPPYFVHVTKTGYTDYRFVNIAIPDGQTTTLNAYLYIGSLVTGHIYSHGPPVVTLSGAQVIADPRERNEYWQEVFSQGDGSYQVRQPPGECQIRVSYPDHACPMEQEIFLEDTIDRSLDFYLYIGGSM